MRHQTFTSIRTEGGLFPPDFLQRITGAVAGVPGLTPEAYHLAGHEKLNEAASRAWNRLLGIWTVFYSTSIPTGDAGTTVTREKWLLPVFAELGYGRLQQARAVDVNGKSYPVSHTWQHVPIHLVGRNVDLDHRTAGVAGAARTSPHSLLQELLNRREESQWGFVSNGLKLRLLRDNRSLTRQAYVEFDLVAMMEGQAFSDFVVLWLMCHQSRVEAVPPEPCWLEKWATEAREQGTRALNELRNGVKDAIESLGRGFLKHPANKSLLEKLRAVGGLDRQDYYRQLLRVVYRLIFLFVAEARELLLIAEPGSAAAERYSRFYSIARLRDLAASRRGTPHGDLWQSLQVVVRGLSSEHGLAELGLPALGSFLWSASATPDLDSCQIANTNLLDAIRALAFRMDGNVRRRVDWRNLGPEELGSVYESLLELHPVLNSAAATFDLNEAPGHERKETGSYYTPTSLVDCLLDSALDPVLDEAAKAADPEGTILHLKVCDPACGSGHFLIAAAHRIARRLGAIRTGDAEASPEAVRGALRDVIGHCLYGVDMNEMAVELCKVNLWLEALDPGKPLSFLDQRIQCGNSLLGSMPALLRAGIPDEAFEPIEGDDPEQCRKLKRWNRDEKKAFHPLFNTDAWKRIGDLANGIAALDGIDDSTLQGVHEKESRYAELVRSSGYDCGRLWADSWCAAFVWRKAPDVQPLTEKEFRTIEQNPAAAPAALRDEVRRLAQQYRFFHWHLAFPDVFHVPPANEPLPDGQGWTGGFDVVLGNPPWERIKIQEKEWFAERRPDIAEAPNAAARKRIIKSLKDDDPALWSAWCEALRQSDGEAALVRSSSRYPLCGRGDINTYAIFAEMNRSILGPRGRTGFIVPTGIATDDTTKEFFQTLVDSRELGSIFGFENEDRVFPGVHHAVRFCLLTITGPGRPENSPEFAFFLRSVPELRDTGRRFRLDVQDIALLNPNTRTCPIFRTKRDADLTKSIYERVPVLVKESVAHGNPWSVTFFAMFHMSGASPLFRTMAQLESNGWTRERNIFVRDDERYLPLYEAKMVHHYDHRFGTYEGQTEAQARQNKLPEMTDDQHLDPNYPALPENWIPEAEMQQRLRDRWNRDWLLGWRDTTGTEKIRTVIASVIPRMGAGDKFLLMMPAHPRDAAVLCAILDSFALDYCARQKVGGTSLKYFTMRQLPIPLPASIEQPVAWTASMPLRGWIEPRVLELICTAWEVEPFASELSHMGPPFRWNRDRRFQLRCELDAALLHVYGLNRDDASYILETFPIIRRNDERYYGEYRTKHTILDIYDRMQHAIDTGEPYQTMLDPPPADVSLCHPKKKVGVLAFGSLIHTPGDELRAKTTMKIRTKTPFPVEYGRYSRKRGDAATLVPHPKGAQVNAEIFVMADDVSLQEAKDMLYRREIGQVGGSKTYTGGSGPNDVIIDVHTDNPWVETVAYTNFNTSGKIAEPAAAQLADRAIASVGKVEEGEDGITYLQRNISYGIETPLTQDYEGAILAQTGTTRLQDALAKLQQDGRAREAGTNE